MYSKFYLLKQGSKETLAYMQLLLISMFKFLCVKYFLAQKKMLCSPSGIDFGSEAESCGYIVSNLKR